MLIKNIGIAQISAKEWHKSEEGRRWHKDHYERIKDKLFVKNSFVCGFCSKEFKSTKVDAKYCCNNCRAAARRASGVDDIKVVCEICGKEYMTNKYSSSKTCSSECRNKLIWIKRRSN